MKTPALLEVDFEQETLVVDHFTLDLMKSLEAPPYHLLSERGREQHALLKELHERLPGGLNVPRTLISQKTLVNRMLRENTDPGLPDRLGDFWALVDITEGFYADYRKVQISGRRTYYYVS